MDSLRKTRDILRDIVELYIPAAAFVIMFVMFVVQIFFRYVLRNPLDMAYEITVSCYLWLVILGACYAQRDRSHVVFTLITDKMPLRLRAFCTFFGGLLIAFAFTWSFLPSVEFVGFMARQKTSSLKIGLNIVYAPYIPFLALMILYMLRDMITDFKVFTGLASEEDVKTYLRNNMSEADQALEHAKEGTVGL
ncbi:MAG: TRAP transporter small permease [Clostridiales bacterium]|nr:TRAP transporter small permease [Clostridiales bacterium]OPZ70036.1 MAG: Tripartite ATP-independent periplasmic transporter [Firmicutes bacterium ADurb.Bin467]